MFMISFNIWLYLITNKAKNCVSVIKKKKKEKLILMEVGKVSLWHYASWKHSMWLTLPNSSPDAFCNAYQELVLGSTKHSYSR